MVAISYRGSEPAAQHKAAPDGTLKHATATLRVYVNNSVEHALAPVTPR
jgi:GntR family transcriptional regulator, carbon starvation induced regulator